jgi:hypothetical protein
MTIVFPQYDCGGPRCIVDQCKLSKVITFMECADDTPAIDNDVDRTLQDDIPRLALITLVEY